MKTATLRLASVIAAALFLAGCRPRWFRPPAWSEHGGPIWVLAPVPSASEAATAAARIAKVFTSARAAALSESPAVMQDCLDRDALLVVLDVSAFPQTHWSALQDFVNHGGSVLFVGTRPFEQRTVLNAATLVPEQNQLAIAVREHAVSLPSISTVAGWEQAADSPTHGRIKLASSPVPGWGAVTIEGEQLGEWRALTHTNAATGAWPAEYRTMVFYARGSEVTSRLFVQCTEQDGSVWRVSVPLTRLWNLHVLHEGELEFVSGPPPRGSASDAFSFARMRSMSIGTSALTDLQADGSYRFDISDVRWFADARKTEDVRRWPDLPLLSPPIRQYATTCKRIRSVSDGRRWTLDQPLTVASPFPRSRGWGGNDGTDFRWIPLFEALDDHDTPLGWPASVYVEMQSNRVVRQWAWVGVDADCSDSLFESMVIEAARTLRAGVYLHHAGSPRFVITSDEPLTISAQVAWRSARPLRLDIIAELYRQDEPVPGRRLRVPLSSEGHAELSLGPVPSVGSEAENWSIRLDLVEPERGILYDTLTQPFIARQRRAPPDRTDWITTGGSQFLYHGRRQFWIGVRYCPASTMGLLPSEAPLARWLAPGLFDPLLVERDFDRLAETGVNAIFLEYSDASEAPALLHIAEVARRRGLWLYLRLPEWDPLRPDNPALKKLFDAAQLDSAPTIMALDIPPKALENDEQGRLDQAWRDWLVEQYGTLEHAERVLERKLERNEAGDICVPRKDDLEGTDESRQMLVRVFRRFLRDFYSRRIGYVVRCLRSWGAGQLITAHAAVVGASSMAFRSAWQPLPWWGCAHLDFYSLGVAPHAPARQRSIEHIFGAACARGVSGGRPLLWCDLSVPMPDAKPTAFDLQAQTSIFKNMFDLAFQIRSSGLFGGCFAGGSRSVSHPDSGLTEPDGTWRPVAMAFREAANRLRRERTVTGLPSKGRVISIEDDAELNSDFYLSTYAEDLAAGAVAEFRPADWGKRSTEWNVRPCGGGKWIPPAPMCSLNAEWGRLEISGREILRMPGDMIEMRKGDRFHAQIVNTGPVSWDASRQTLAQSVWIRFSCPGRPPMFQPLPPTAFGKSATVVWTAGDAGEWTARPWLADVGEFGEVLHIRVAD